MKTMMATLFFLLVLGSQNMLDAQVKNHTYIYQVADTITVDAMTAAQIPVFLENNGAATVTLEARVQGDVQFSIDSLSMSTALPPNMHAVITVDFHSDSGGTYTALLTVTDGNVTDSVLLTAIVIAPPIVLLPPFHTLYADLGVPLQFSVTVQNLTNTVETISIGITGDPDFTYNGPATVQLQAHGMHTIVLVFLASTEGRKSGTLEVSTGSYSAQTQMNVTTVNSPHTWITDVTNNIVVAESREAILFVSLRNTAVSPVTLDVTLTGGPEFRFDSTMQQLTVDNSAQLVIHFVSPVVGTYTTLLTVTDGIDIDTVTLVVRVYPGPGNFVLQPMDASIRVPAQTVGHAEFSVRNTSNLPLTLTAAIIGDSRFSLDDIWPYVLPAKEIAIFRVNFSAAAVGVYRAQLVVSSGSESDTIPTFAIVNAPHGGNDLYILEPCGNNGSLMFEAAPAGSDVKTVQVHNLSSAPITVDLSIMGDSCFVLSTRSVTLDSGMSKPVTITYLNPSVGRGFAHLISESGSEHGAVGMWGATTAWTDKDGFRVMNYLDFGSVDTTTQFCRDVLLINTTGQEIGITNAQLSGFAPDFTVTSSTAFNISAGDTAAISICYTPTSQIYIDNEVLTFTADNPASTPRVQTFSVNVTGRSITNPLPHLDSIRMVIIETHTMIAPIDGFVENIFEMHNLAARPIVLDRLLPIYNDAITLLTPLPITLPAYDSMVAGSGTTTIRVRYAPTSAHSTPGEEDNGVLSFTSPDTLLTVIYSISIFGKPVLPIPSSNIIALYPTDGLPPVITLGEAENQSHHMLRFRNNLSIPITITSCGLEASSYAEIVSTDALPAMLQPDETITIELKVTKTVQSMTSDAIILHGSHDHLNSRYEIYNGKMTTSVGVLPVQPTELTVHASPNPSAGVVTVQVSTALRSGRIRILDMLGRTVADFDAGNGTVVWNARSGRGQRTAAGTYLIHVNGIDEFGEQRSALRKLVLLP